MKKAALLLLCAALLTALLCPAAAYSAQELNTADALYHLRLFLGTGESYSLDRELTREQGITLLVRMLGKETEALSGTWQHPFTDVNGWAQSYVGYAYHAKLTNGVSQTLFAGSKPMTAQMFVTLCLRALGYSDGGASPEFVWNDSVRFAAKKGILDSAAEIPTLTRGRAVEIFWRVLHAAMAGGGSTLADTLISAGAFTVEEYGRADEIAVYGRDASEDTGEEPETEPESGEGVTYPQFQAMSPEERAAVKAQFASVAEYKAWIDRIRTEYENSLNIIVVDGSDIGGL